MPLAVVRSSREPRQPAPVVRNHVRMCSWPRSHSAWGGIDIVASSCSSAISASMSYASNAVT